MWILSTIESSSSSCVFSTIFQNLTKVIFFLFLSERNKVKHNINYIRQMCFVYNITVVFRGKGASHKLCQMPENKCRGIKGRN